MWFSLISQESCEEGAKLEAVGLEAAGLEADDEATIPGTVRLETPERAGNNLDPAGEQEANILATAGEIGAALVVAGEIGIVLEAAGEIGTAPATAGEIWAVLEASWRFYIV